MQILTRLEEAGNKGVYRRNLLEGGFSLNDNFAILEVLVELNLVELEGELYWLEPEQFDLSSKKVELIRDEVETALLNRFEVSISQPTTSIDFSEREKPTKGKVKRFHLLAYPLTLVFGSLFFSNQIMDGDWDMPTDDEMYIQDLKFKMDSLRAARPTERDTMTFDLQ